MKNKIMFWVIIVCIIGIIIIIKFQKYETINMESVVNAKIVFNYNDLNLNKQCTEEELVTICNIFNNKSLYKDNLSCGFCEEIAIQINEGQTFCIACDSCPIIYWKEKEKYFKLSKDEMNQIYKIFSQYGANFPCV